MWAAEKTMETRRRTATVDVVVCLVLMLAACSPSDEGSPSPASNSIASSPNAANTEPKPPAPRIILLVSIDTLRADHLGLYGHERFTSPILDQFAAQGIVFDDASSTAPWTLPAHASLLTGLFPDTHGVTNVQTSLPEQIPTLAGLLSKAGYKTAAVVNSTWLKQSEFGLTRDFDQFQFVKDDPARRAPNDWVTDQAIEWLRGVTTGKLFLFVHYYDVHSDYVSEPAYEKLFVSPYDGIADGTAWQLTQANLEDDYLEMCHERFDPARCTFAGTHGNNVIDQSVERIRFDEPDVRHLEELYDAGIRQLDTEVGRLFGALDQAGLADDALVVITSDHGEEFMEHGRVDHFLTMYQEVLRVPLILRGPGIPAGLRSSAPVSIIDVAPTILTLAGARVPASLEGSDLSPLWRSADDAPWQERLLFGEASGGLTFKLVAGDYFPVYRSVRQGRYKLVHDTKSDRFLLFDLVKDPREKTDMATAMPEVASRLTEILRARQLAAESGAPTGNPVVLPEEDAERLRALGYLP